MLSEIAQFPATMVTWKIEREVFLTWKLIFQPFFYQKYLKYIIFNLINSFMTSKNKTKIISKLEINLKPKILPSSDLFF